MFLLIVHFVYEAKLMLDTMEDEEYMWEPWHIKVDQLMRKGIVLLSISHCHPITAGGNGVLGMLLSVDK